MHRRAIISDIHGNLPAFEAVMADIAAQNVDDIVCLGDNCGYGPQPVECINKIREISKWTLLGNHDEAIFIEPAGFSSNAYDAIVWQRKLLDPAHGAPGTAEVRERLEWLKSLNAERIEKNVLYVHAAPMDPLHEYVLKEDYDAASGGPTAEAKRNFDKLDWLCFCGHSHRPGVVSEDFHWLMPDELSDGCYALRPGFKTIINVGSVGQPRDKNPDACYVIFESPKYKKSISAVPVVPEAKVAQAQTLVIPRKNSERNIQLTQVMPRTQTNTSGTHLVGKIDEETRTESDPALSEARKTIMLRMAKVTFRRVPYDVAEASSRVFAVPDLPKYNGIRLARGL